MKIVQKKQNSEFDLTCNLFPGRLPAGSAFLSANDSAFIHWKKIWEAILQLGEGERLTADSFCRQDLICSIECNGRTVGMIALSAFNMGQLATRNLSYLKPFDPNLLDNAIGEKKHILSIEYLSVEAEFRKSELDVSLGSILLGLSMKIFAETSASAVLGTARSKLHVDEMCYNYGFVPVGEMQKFGHPCTLIINQPHTLKQHPDASTRKLIEEIWNSRNGQISEALLPKEFDIAA